MFKYDFWKICLYRHSLSAKKNLLGFHKWTPQEKAGGFFLRVKYVQPLKRDFTKAKNSARTCKRRDSFRMIFLWIDVVVEHNEKDAKVRWSNNNVQIIDHRPDEVQMLPYRFFELLNLYFRLNDFMLFIKNYNRNIHFINKEMCEKFCCCLLMQLWGSRSNSIASVIKLFFCVAWWWLIYK